MSSINKKLRHMVVYAAFAMAGTFLHSAQEEQKRSASLCKILVKPDSSVGKKSVPEQYFTCIDNLHIVPTVLAELIAQYAYNNIKFSHEKLIFQHMHQPLTFSVFLSPRYIATGASGNCNIKLWHYKEACYMHIIGKHKAPLTALMALSNSSNSFASGSRNGTIKIWNFETGRCQCTLDGRNQAITALAELPYGLLVSASNSSVNIWNLLTGSGLGSLGRSTRDEIPSNGINLSSEKTFNPVVSLIPMRENSVEEVTTNNISQLIIKNGGMLRVRIHYHTETHDIRAATRGGDDILIATNEPCLKILNPGDGENVQTEIVTIPLKYVPTCLAYHEGTAFVGHVNGSISVIDISTKSCIQQELCSHEYIMDMGDYSISNILPRPDGSIIVCCLRGCMHLFKLLEDLT